MTDWILIARASSYQRARVLMDAIMELAGMQQTATDGKDVMASRPDGSSVKLVIKRPGRFNIYWYKGRTPLKEADNV